jgi:hypothetical protein
MLTDVIFEDERLFFKKNLYRVISLGGAIAPIAPPWIRPWCKPHIGNR